MIVLLSRLTGSMCLAGSDDETAKLWDTVTGKSNLQTFPGHNGYVNGVAFSPDGKYILTAGWENLTAKLWDVATGQVVRTFIGHTGYIWSVAFSPDGKYVLTGSNDKTAKLWGARADTTADSGTPAPLSVQKGSFKSVAVSPDGKYVLAGSSDNTARLLDTTTGAVARNLTGHTGIRPRRWPSRRMGSRY